jgi:hypothetical protein
MTFGYRVGNDPEGIRQPAGRPTATRATGGTIIPQRVPEKRLNPALSVAVIVVCVAVFHGPSFLRYARTVHPETTAFLRYNEAHVRSLRDCFTVGPRYPGLYRPLTTSCYYYVGRALFGERILPYKVVNLCVYAANAVLFYFVCRLWLASWWSLLTALLFATRSAHTPLVLFSPEIQTLLSFFFSLLMLYFFARCRRESRLSLEVLSYVAFVLALLCKETSVTMAAVVVVYGWLFDGRWHWRPYAVTAALALLWSYGYFVLFRGAEGYRVVAFSYSFSPPDLIRNYIGHALDFFGYLMGAADSPLPPMGGTIEAAAGSVVGQVAFGALALACLYFLVRLRSAAAAADDRVRLIVFGGAIFLLAMVPYVIVQGRWFPRYSYAGHAGIALMIGASVSLVERTRWFSRLASRFGRRGGPQPPPVRQ